MSFVLRFLAMAAVAAAGPGALTANAKSSEGPMAVDSRAWEELDIVPMPKELRLGDERLALDPEKVALVVGSTADPKARFGVEWINRRIAEAGGKPLSVITENDSEAGERFRIVVGTREDQPLIARAAEGGVLDIDAENPGRHGYVVAKAERALYLAGSDPQGALYACVTFGELLEPGAVPRFRVCEIRDWPDFYNLTFMPGARGTSRFPGEGIIRRVMNDKTGSLRGKCLEEFARTLDFMLRRKIPTYFFQSQSTGGVPALLALTPEARETLRQCTELARARGIETFYYDAAPFVGLKRDLPEPDPRFLVQDSYVRTGRYKDWIRSWSMDEERRDYAKKLAEVVKAVGFDKLGFHDTDSGIPENPAQWASRSEADRERWGDDYAAATINQHRIFYEELTRAVPNLEIHFTLMPYTIHNLGDDPAVPSGWTRGAVGALREKTLAFWRTVHSAFPSKNISFCIREASPDAVDNFRRNIPGRPLLIWYGTAAETVFNNSPAWLKTFFRRNSNDIVFTGQEYVGSGFVPLLDLAMREYSWNVDAPGSAACPAADENWQAARNNTASETYRIILPRLIRNYFGREVADDVAAAVRENPAPYPVLAQKVKPGMEVRSEEAMGEQVGRAEAAARAIDRAWAKAQRHPEALRHADPYAAAGLVYLREVFHATHWIASLRLQLYRAESRMAVARFDEAQRALEEGERLHVQAKEALSQLAGERPGSIAIPAIYSANWTLQHQLDKRAGELLAAMKRQLQIRRKSGAIPPDQFQAFLRRNREVTAFILPNAPEVDGEIGAGEWRGAYPAGSVFEGGKGEVATAAPAEFLVATHGGRLYIAFKAPYLPGSGAANLRQRELIRIYLQTGAEEAPALALELFERGLSYAAPPEFLNDVQHKIRSIPGGWQGEVSLPLPLESAGSQRRLFFARGYGNETMGGVNALLPLGPILTSSFRNLTQEASKFPHLVIVNEPFRPVMAPPSISEVEFQAETLDDGIFSVLRFTVNIEANRMIDDVSLVAELKATDGRPLVRQTLLEHARLPYALQLGGLRMICKTAVSEGILSLQLKSGKSMIQSDFQLELAGTDKQPQLKVTPLPTGSTGPVPKISAAP